MDSTLTKGLLILETLSRSKGGRGVSELSRELGLTKSMTFRLLQTLSVLGYVRSSQSKQYSATMKVWQAGQSVIDGLDLPKVAAPHMRSLSESTGETIYLAVPDGVSVIYIDKIESTKPHPFLEPGGRQRAHALRWHGQGVAG